MREAFEAWWHSAVDNDITVSFEDMGLSWQTYLDDREEYKSVAWLAWQSAYYNMRKPVEV